MKHVDKLRIVNYVDEIAYHTACLYGAMDDKTLEGLAELVVMKGDLVALAIDSPVQDFKRSYHGWLQSYFELYYYVRG